METIEHKYYDLTVTFYDPDIERAAPFIIEDGISNILLSLKETIALRDFLNSLDLDEKKDCKDGQHSGDTGKCSECGRTYIHGAK